MSEHRITITLMSCATLLAFAASGCLFTQGGFGGGHGDLDRVLFTLALPWSLIPWPGAFVGVAFVWLVLLPFALNVSAIVVGTYVVWKIKRHRRSALEVTTAH